MINRRNFLMQIGVVGSAMLAMPTILSAKESGRLGFQLYNLRDYLPKDVPAVIAEVAKAGYNFVETFGYTAKSGFWGLSAQEFKALLTKHKLKTYSGHYNFGQLFVNGDLTEIDEAVAAAKILGQKFVVIPWMQPELLKDLEGMNKIIGFIKKAAQRVKAAGLKLAYHNHDFEFRTIEGKMFMSELIEHIDASLLAIELDIYWVIRMKQDPVAWFEKYPGRFKLVHIKDMDKENNHLNTEIGTGAIDFVQILKKSKVGGVEYLIMEQENFKIDPYVSIQQSAKYMRSTLLK